MSRLSRLLQAAATLALSLSASLAHSQTQTRPCAERNAVVERLAERYGETLQSMGMHANNGVLEVYASETTGTWTILVTTPDGNSCMIAAGEMWEGRAAPLTKPGKDV